MTRRLAFRARLTPPAEPAPLRNPGPVIVLVVAGAWFACVALAWGIAGAVRLVVALLEASPQ